MFPFVRSAYNYDMDEASAESGLFTDLEVDPSRTVQSQKDEADINVIVRNFGLTGTVPGNYRPPLLEDFNEVVDFHSAMNAVKAAERSFMQVPAELRARFGNDPQRFVEFCSDEANLDEMRKLGLANPAPVVDNPVAPNSGASGVVSDGQVKVGSEPVEGAAAPG